ncbi:hypothetical protein [Lysobacter gummosus]|uniref:hypothetical protein n=1 Tax=Lysobacter gummosus TaxID=262324 RepID=UPI00363269D4
MQIVGDHFADVAIVIDDQDVIELFHAQIPPVERTPGPDSACSRLCPSKRRRRGACAATPAQRACSSCWILASVWA